MRILRSLIRIPAIPIITLSVYSIYLLGILPATLFGKQKEEWRNDCLKRWAALMATTLGLRIEAVGEVPRPPFMLVTNHLSYLDIVPIYRLVNCVFIAKKEAGEMPVFGRVVRDMGTILIDRGRKQDLKRVIGEIHRAMNSHQGVVLFPEGTTSSGERLLPFRASLLDYPAQEEIPVHYGAIHYRTGPNDLPATSSVCWWGDMPPLPHLWRLTGNRHIYCTVRFGTEPLLSNDRKLLAAGLEQRVGTLLQGSTEREEPVSAAS